MPPAGNRVKVVENSGRTVVWAYDDLYRLTNETVSASAAGQNYSASYGFDAVGNRQARAVVPTGVMPQVPDQDFTGDYDDNDRLLGGYGYDNNGSTITAPGGWNYTYDAENRLLTAENSGVKIDYIYDGEGARAIRSVYNKLTLTTTITRYLTDTQNPTGYAQVVEELNGAYGVQRRYVYGVDLISQTNLSSGSTHYYGYDGIGSTRLLTDSSGDIAAEYDYDAFGAPVYSSGAISNSYLFHGEQFDADLGQYYLRARWYEPGTGRFVTMDGFEGMPEEPGTLHKYLSFNADPVNKQDPSGYYYTTAIGALTANLARTALIGISTLVTGQRISELLKQGNEETFYHYTDFMGAASILSSGVIKNPKGNETYFGKNFTLWTEVAHEYYALPMTPKAVFVVRLDPVLWGVKFVGKVKERKWQHKDSFIELAGGFNEYTTTMTIPLTKMLFYSWLFPPLMEPVKGSSGIYRYPIANFYNRLNTF